MDPEEINRGIDIGWKLTAVLATLGGWLSAASGAVAVAFYRLRRLEKQVSVDSQRDTRRLYNEDGLPIYMMRTECDARGKVCRDHINEDFKNLREEMHNIDKRQEERFKALLNAIIEIKSHVDT